MSSANVLLSLQLRQAQQPETHYKHTQSRSHSRELLTKLAELRDESQLCDVTLNAKGTRINAHRNVLAASSNYFRAMFTIDMAEKHLRMLYSDHDAAGDVCGLNTEHREHCRDRRIFIQLSFKLFVEIISSEELMVQSEEEVYAAALKWTKFDLPAREKLLPKLLEHVRLPLCPPKFLVNTVSKDSLVMADAACRELVDEAKNCLLLQLPAPGRPSMQGPRTRPRKPFKFPEVLYLGTMKPIFSQYYPLITLVTVPFKSGCLGTNESWGKEILVLSSTPMDAHGGQLELKEKKIWWQEHLIKVVMLT
ncbi:BTB And Kelch, partial [Ostertagia ostertagi]